MTFDVLVIGRVVEIKSDLVIRDVNGTYRYIEVKNGKNAGLSKNQKVVDDALIAGESLAGTVRGKKLDPTKAEHADFLKTNEGGFVTNFVFEIVEVDVP